VLLLGHRHQQLPGAELAFETGDQAIAEAVLAVYLALTEERSAKRALRSADGEGRLRAAPSRSNAKYATGPVHLCE